MQKAAAQRSPRIRDKGVNMILADKIINMRKKAGWSQEELAEQLGVSRQSVSKWESSQSVPDMDKIVRMSDIFSVSTDFLLKDELSMDDQIPQVQSSEPGLRRVSMEEASEFMDLRAKAAPFFALNTLLCVASPVLLILLGGLSEVSEKLSENVAVGTGLCALIIMVAIAVMGFIKCSSPSSRYSFLEKEPFETELQRWSGNSKSFLVTTVCQKSYIQFFQKKSQKSHKSFDLIIKNCLIWFYIKRGRVCLNSRTPMQGFQFDARL